MRRSRNRKDRIREERETEKNKVDIRDEKLGWCVFLKYYLSRVIRTFT